MWPQCEGVHNVKNDGDWNAVGNWDVENVHGLGLWREANFLISSRSGAVLELRC